MLWMRRIALVLAALALAGAGAAGPEGEDGLIVSVAVRDFASARLRRAGLDLLMEKGGRVYIVASPGDLAALNARRIPFTDETLRLRQASLRGLSAAGGINGAFHDALETEAELRALEAGYPELASVREIGQTLEKRKILALKISDNAASDEREPALLFVGCHHAREWISVEVPLLFGRYLLQSYATDPAVRALVDESEVWIVPIANPDGLEYSVRVYRYWRKNRRANADRTFGVDINRNYGYAWGFDDVGSSGQPASEVYRGTAAFSEPETAAIRALVLGLDLRAMISFHSFGQDILFPWGFTTQAAPTDAELRTVGRAMAGLIEGVNGRPYLFGEASSALYLTNGDTVDWTYSLAGAPSYTIELPPVDIDHGGFFNDEAAIGAIFEENRPAMLYLIRYGIDHPRSLDIRRLVRPKRSAPGPARRSQRIQR